MKLATRVAALLAVALALTGCGDEKRWRQFKIEHHCKVSQQMPERSSYGNSMKDGSLVVTSQDAMTGWLCDDGVVYWHEAE